MDSRRLENMGRVTVNTELPDTIRLGEVPQLPGCSRSNSNPMVQL